MPCAGVVDVPASVVDRLGTELGRAADTLARFRARGGRRGAVEVEAEVVRDVARPPVAAARPSRASIFF